MNNDTINQVAKDTDIELPIKRRRGRPKNSTPPPPKPEKRSLYLDDPKAYFIKY